LTDAAKNEPDVRGQLTQPGRPLQLAAIRAIAATCSIDARHKDQVV